MGLLVLGLRADNMCTPRVVGDAGCTVEPQLRGWSSLWWTSAQHVTPPESITRDPTPLLGMPCIAIAHWKLTARAIVSRTDKTMNNSSASVTV
jgi:hypothetical protein